MTDSYRKKCNELYGVDNTFQSEIIKDRIKNTCLERYSVENPQQCKEISDKTRKTQIEKYGDLAFCFHGYRGNMYKYDNISFDSSAELIYYIYAKEILHKNIERGKIFEYSLDGEIHRYHCDFNIDGENVEIKSNNFYDSDGHLTQMSSKKLNEAKEKCMEDNHVKIILTNSAEYKKALVNVYEIFGKEFISQFKLKEKLNEVK